MLGGEIHHSTTPVLHRSNALVSLWHLHFALNAPSWAADAPQRVRIAYASRSSSAMPLYMAEPWLIS